MQAGLWPSHPPPLSLYWTAEVPLPGIIKGSRGRGVEGDFLPEQSQRIEAEPSVGPEKVA